jgi:hypothetical protein
MGVYRGFIVWGAGILLVLGAFLMFVLVGWPGKVNNCVDQASNGCYCEAFNLNDAVTGAPGVRQKVNTWFNLYAIGTSFVVALFIFFDRSGSSSYSNLISSNSLIADLYIFAVLFLGLGSMWFHASIKAWGGVTDQLSMFVFAAFLVFYTILRWWASELFFWIGYLATVAVFTFVAAVWTFKFSSLILILILVAAYAIAEFWISGSKPFSSWKWWSAVGSILAATLFWSLSQTGGPLCDPKSFFQPHGLLWHPLAGVMAVFMYFYWRQDVDTPQAADDSATQIPLWGWLIMVVPFVAAIVAAFFVVPSGQPPARIQPSGGLQQQKAKPEPKAKPQPKGSPQRAPAPAKRH